jgi:hypothetical protein
MDHARAPIPTPGGGQFHPPPAVSVSRKTARVWGVSVTILRRWRKP